MNSRNLFFVWLTVMTVSWSGKAETNDITSNILENPGHDGLATAINDFGYKLSLEMMKQSPNSNVVLSPAGIAGLLAMTLLGSVGKTYDELADALGFSQDLSENRLHHVELGDLLKNLNTESSASSSTTLYADTVIADATTKLREDYRKYLQRVYRGDAMTVDFNDPNSTVIINEWVKEHTLGKIEKFLKEPLPIQTKVVLLSALYFSGQWMKPFVPEHTRKMTFTTPIGDIMVDSMLNLGWFNYTTSIFDGVQMLAFPYIDNTTTMYILKPIHPKKLNLSDALQSLNYSKIDDLITQMQEKECVIRFPKMELKTRVDLKDSLRQIGVNTVFDPVEANFALMVDGNTVVNRTEDELITRVSSGWDTHWREVVNRLPNPGVHVDSVLHDVKITIDEFGTEAVAASSGFLARTAQLFYVQSPFYMFIRNERTKLVTFSAVIFDPTA